MNYFNRDEYLNFLISFKDKQLIKVVSGIRRCGKSTLFEIYKNYLLANGITKDQIISINFESIEFEDLKDYKSLYDYVMSKVNKQIKNYIFLDEIQNCLQFEKAVDSLFIKDCIDVYITGSNAYFMSGELATLLTGRYVQLNMLPLSFKEYVDSLNNSLPLIDNYNNYIIQSSFPYTLSLNNSYSEISEYLNGLYSSIILKDVVSRNKISDIMMLESVIQFIFDNIGNRFSSLHIANVMSANGRKIDVKTVEKYIRSLIDALLIYRVKRYNVKGMNVLKTQEKYYIADVALRYLLLGTKNQDRGRILENVVYLELIRRGYKVFIGQNESTEIDFIASKFNETFYVQVAESILNQDTLNRELTSLNNLSNHYPKLLLTLDNIPDSDYNGIKCVYALKWLIEK